MALRDQHPRAGEHEVLPRRFGRLVAVPQDTRARGNEVRCECSRCGAHLLATAVGGGTLAGTCPVCLSQQFRPVGDPR